MRDYKQGQGGTATEGSSAREGGAPGKRTLTGQLVQRKAASDADGTKPPEETEKVGASLWAKDDKGNDLPPSIEDVKQGGLNDCYAFATMAALVHSDASLIQGMIKDNGDGTYTVTFKGDATIKAGSYTVTADFVKGKHGKVAGRNAFWPLIIEKAYAQAKGGLDKLDTGGDVGNAINDFVDMGTTRFDPRTKDNTYILAQVAKARTKNLPITLSTPKEEDAGDKKKEMTTKITGLHFWHAYVLLEVDEKAKKVKLFNPWGYDHPGGDGWVDVDVIRTFFREVRVSE